MSLFSLFLATACAPTTSDVVMAPSSPAPVSPTAPAATAEPPSATDSQSETPTSTGTSATVDPTETEEPTEPEEPTETEDPCPPGVICLDTFPWVDRNDTAGAPTQYDGYSCAPTIDESGPEVVYRLDLAEDGLLALELENLGSGVDVDVRLSSLRVSSPVGEPKNT